MKQSANFDWVQNGTRKFVDLWMYNFARNIPDVLDGNSARLLNVFRNGSKSRKNHKPDQPAIVIGAGPNVYEKKHLEVLANSNYKGVIACTDRMLAPCLKNGITPKKFPRFFVLSMDPYEVTIKYYQDEIIKKYSKKISIVMSTCTIHETVEICKNYGFNIFWYHPLIDDFRKLESINKIMNMMSKSDKNPDGFPGLQTGGNVGCFSWIFSWAVLGCSPIGLIGLNMGVDGNTPIEKTAHYSQVLNHFNNEKSKVSKRYRKVFNKEYGTETLLDPVFDFYREAFLDLVVRTPRWTRTVNATEGGSLFGNRIENMKFTDFLTLIKS
jgi:hypothetical protein